MRIEATEVLASRAGDDLFLVDRGSGDSHQLGGSAPWLWELLVDRGLDTTQVVTTVVEESDAAAAEVERDLDGFIRQLVDIGAVRIVEP